MIKFENNVLKIGQQSITLPIRIKEVRMCGNLYLTVLGFSAKLDCDYTREWNEEVDSKWNEIHKSYGGTTLFAYNSSGKEVWRFEKPGYVNIASIHSDKDLRIVEWIKGNTAENVVLVYHDQKHIVDCNSGTILATFIDK